MATILQHSNAPVKFDPPTEAEAAAEAFEAQIRISVALELLDRLVMQFGAARVTTWLQHTVAAREAMSRAKP